VTGEDIMSAAKSIFNKKQAVTGWLTTAPEASQ